MFPLFDLILLDNSLDKENDGIVFTSLKAFAISNVPTVSIFAATIGIPLYFAFEFLKIISRCRSTWKKW